MSARELLTSLEQQGFRLQAENGRLLVAPISRLDSQQWAALRAAKAEILGLLTPEVPPFEYRLFEGLHLEISAESCPQCGAALYCWSAPPHNDEIGYACREQPQVHRWVARLSDLFK